MRFFAHSLPGRPPEQWEDLRDHLELVARKAQAQAEAFGAAEWGRLAGLWHDLGKYRRAFQEMLLGERVQVEHAGAGALHAHRLDAQRGLPLAFVIAGHHAGLANFRDERGSGLTPLDDRLKSPDNAAALAEVATRVPPDLRDLPLPPFPDLGRASRDDLRRRFELWTRFLFSALVDADFLATEAFYQPGRRDDLVYDPLSTLVDRLDHAIDARAAAADPTPVNHLRAEVLAACRTRAADAPGRFSLTVPTGGGKTLAAMSFALRHAVAHGLRRVIVVIPYTSIIEQNARVYRDALGEANVLEHHSNLDEQQAYERNSEQELRRRLSAENWDAPVIVTTSVQFLESLLANRTSRCRKLHNVARSVIVLDEVQTLPPSFLTPILDVLGELTDRYGCSLVLSTATPPALTRQTLPDAGLDGVREIVPDPASLARRLRRVRVTWHAGAREPMPYEALAERLAGHEKVLAITHRRADARRLAELLAGTPGLFHLSALMCPAHRLDVLGRVRAAVKEPGPCRLVATQLVEAGVDLDFPVVYRALAGLDSLAQAAGRCNREGRLTGPDGEPALGELVVFRAETAPPPGALRKALVSTVTMLNAHGADGLDIFEPAACVEFFQNLYFKSDRDAEGVQAERAALNFATVAQKFRLIDDYAEAIVVPYGPEAAERIRAFAAAPSRVTRRALTPYLVQVAPHARQQIQDALEPLDEGLYALTPAYAHLYDADLLGLNADPEPLADPAVLNV